MEHWIEFIIARYNYWIVIILMMTGLYTVFARGNLVKKLVGLNVFQTSVFIFYITIGKIAGATAPIFLSDDPRAHGSGHGGEHNGHGSDHSADHSTDVAHDASQTVAHEAVKTSKSLHDKIDNSATITNDLKSAVANLPEEGTSVGGDTSLHEVPVADEKIINKISNHGLEEIKPEDPHGSNQITFDAQTPESAHGAVTKDQSVEGEVLHDAAAAGAEVLYSNPLPHVLILTAIVVGIATTAVGLALAVRIREAYGTIEEDELEAIDNVAEFGASAGESS